MTTAAVLLFGTATAAAQENDPTAPSAPTETTTPSQPPSSTPTPTEPTTPPSESTPPSEPSAPTTPSTPAQPETPVQPEAPKQEEPAKPEEKAAAPQADLKVAVSFDKAKYEAGADLGLTVTISNVGAAPAPDIRFATETSSIWLRSGYEQLSTRPTLGPGEHKTFKLTASPKSTRNSSVDYMLRAYREGVADPTPGDNESRASAQIIQRLGTASGVLYADKNGNGKADAGEGIANTYLGGQGGSPSDFLSARTDENGRFTTMPASAGKYVMRIEDSTQKLTVKPGVVVIEEGKNTSVDLEAIETTMDSLKPAVQLDKDVYGQGSPVSVKVTLTNIGKAPLTGIVALCDWGGPEWYLKGNGPGWAPLNPDGPGVSIAVGETKVITVTDVVPDAAYIEGEVGVACNFSNNGRNPFGTVGASDWAKVEGAFGDVRGKVVNKETGEAIPQARVVALDPVTRRPIVGTNAGADGQWQLQHVRQGDIVFQVVGPWKHADGSTGLPVKIVGGGEVAADIAVVPGPPVVDPTIHKPDLEVTASFDKPSYDVNDQIQIKVKVANIGTGFQVNGGYLDVEYLENAVDYDQAQLAPLRATNGLWPGESRETTLVGAVRQYSPKDTVAFKAYLAWGDNTNPDNDKVDISAKITYDVGDATVTVYGDRNENGQLDAGEALSGRQVNVYGGRPNMSKEGVSDASGKVAFSGLSAGRYALSPLVVENDEWVPERRYFDLYVDKGIDTPVQLRMVRPLTEKVEAKLQFAKASYQPGEQVSLFVTVQNNGDKPLRIKAMCTGEDYAPYRVKNDNPRWGDWIENGPGYEVEPHRTVSLYVEQPMPEASPDHGFVTAQCTFGVDPQNWGNPTSRTTAKVPGAKWTASGRLMAIGPEYKGVATTKVVLLDPDTKKPVARTTTDANGGFTFQDLPVGRYIPVVVGPWKVASGEAASFHVVRGNTYPVDIYVEPGPDVADPDTGEVLLPPHGGNPPLSKVKGGGLATTGVSVVGLAAFGLLLVMAGAALRGRRRPVIA